MSRWAHTVVVRADVRGVPYLSCSCGWVSAGMWEPSVTKLAEVAQDHRRSATTGPSVTTDQAEETP